MKIIGIITGFLSSGLTGVIVSFFGGSVGSNFLYAGIFGAIFSLIFFKSEILDGGDNFFDGDKSKILMSNSWVYWVSNFLVAVGLSAWYRTGFLWGGFVSSFLGLIIAITVVGLVSSIFSKKG